MFSVAVVEPGRVELVEIPEPMPGPLSNWAVPFVSIGLLTREP